MFGFIQLFEYVFVKTDGAFDVNDLFTLIHSIGASPAIKIRKNAS